MPIDELAGSFLRIVLRFIGEFLLEVVLGIVIKGPGYLILKTVIRKEPGLEEWDVLVVGVLFWVVFGGVGYFISSGLGSATL